jgi:hypothetical protein
MCGCIVALFALVSPRLAIFLTWVFTDRMSVAFNSFWIGLLGFFLLPWTTLAWAWMYAPVRGVTGFGWFLVILGFIADLSTYAGSAKSRQQQQRRA